MGVHVTEQGKSKVLAGGLAAGALIAGGAGVGGYAIGGGFDSSSSGCVLPHITPLQNVELSDCQLQQFASVSGPVYWVGDQPNTKVIAYTNAAGTVELSYVPTNVDASQASEKQYLTVATYRPINGYYHGIADLPASQVTTKVLGNGAIIVVKKSAPLSTFMTFKGATFVVEVFAPKAGESYKFATTNALGPVRASQ